MGLLSLLPWWAKLAIAAAIAVAAYLAWEHYVANPYRAEGEAKVQKEWDADKAARIALTTGIVMAQVERNKVNDAADDQRRLIMDRDFSALATRAAAGTYRPVSVSADSRRLWDDAVRAANADRPATPAADGGGKAPADAVPGPAVAEGEAIYDQRDIDAWKVVAGKSYRDAFDRFLTCRAREDDLRITVNKLTGAIP